MKLVTFEVSSPLGPQRRLGALIDGHQDGRIVDLTLSYTTYLQEETDETQPEGLAALRTPPDMIGWIGGGHKSREAAEQAVAFVKSRLSGSAPPRGHRGEQLVFARSEVKLLSPLPRPNQFRDFSIYEEHGSRSETRGGEYRRYKAPAWYKWPPYYKGNPDAILGPEDPIPYAYYTQKLDLEPEIGIVVGKEGRNLHVEEAQAAIVGYTIVIDCSDRGHGDRDSLGPAKSKDFGTMVGPCLVTADEIDEGNLGVRVLVDGELWFYGNTSSPRSFTAAQLVAYCSDNETVHAGDLLGTGTVGMGASMDIHKWPQVGQTFRMEVDGIGYMEHKVVAGEHIVDYVGSGMKGLLPLPPP